MRVTLLSLYEPGKMYSIVLHAIPVLSPSFGQIRVNQVKIFPSDLTTVSRLFMRIYLFFGSILTLDIF